MGKREGQTRKFVNEGTDENCRLNKLSVANRIHIVEPQWNPSVESQAIGRILRLGQKRSVTIIRYVVEDTVEKAVQSQQVPKLQLSRGGFGISKDDHGTQRVEEIMVRTNNSPIVDRSRVGLLLSETSLSFTKLKELKGPGSAFIPGNIDSVASQGASRGDSCWTCQGGWSHCERVFLYAFMFIHRFL